MPNLYQDVIDIEKDRGSMVQKWNLTICTTSLLEHHLSQEELRDLEIYLKNTSPFEPTHLHPWVCNEIGRAHV